MSLSDTYGKLFNHGIGDTNDFPDNAQSRLEAQKGAPFAPQASHHTWERAVVQAIYPDRHTCDVYTSRGKYLAGIAWPDGGEKAPKRGGRFAVHFQLGKPVLFSVNVDAELPAGDSESHSVLPVKDVGGENAFYDGKGSGNYRGTKPRDLLPGDWLKMGDEGNLIGLLAGGTAVFKAGDLAQIIATQSRHLLRLIGKNLKIDTGAGTLDFKTEDGKSTINLRAGADEETESSPLADNFRIRCELGADGEMVDFRVTDGQGRSLYRMHIDPDGRVQKKSRRETEVVAEDKRTEVGTNSEEFVGKDKTTHVEGDARTRARGSVDTAAGGHVNLRAAGNATMSALSDLLLHAAKNAKVSSSGSPASPDPSMLFEVSNGDFKIDIGNPLKGDAQVMASGLSVDTFTGDIAFKTMLGNFRATTTTPGSVQLGGPVPGLFSAVVFELFQAFMEVFGTMIDTHVHPVPVLGGAPTAPPIIPPWTSSRSLFSLSKSTFVKMGG